MLLKPYTVLDFTDERGDIGPMLMGDLGADVIKIEPAGGCPSRNCPPLAANVDGSSTSLHFQAYNRNKRSIVLDPASSPDLATLSALIQRADFVFESHPHGLLEKFGHDFATLTSLNPQIIHTRVSPFGSDGPHADLLANDLVIAAMGGPVALQGSVDRPPLRLSVPQAWRHAGVEAAAGAMVAWHRMLGSGEAQFVDLSAQCTLTWTMLNAMDAYAIQGFDFERGGGRFDAGGTRFNIVHPTADGHIVALPSSDVLKGCLEWMIEDGSADASLRELDWELYDMSLADPEAKPLNVYEATDILRAFLVKHKKQELFEYGLANGITLAPVNTLEELLALEHMQERAYWHPLALAGGTTVNTPGLWAKSSIELMSLRRPAPTLDEHGDEIRTALASAVNKPVHQPADDIQALPFEGVTVTDFAWVGVGPISAKYLADHGAQVIRVESENRPDVLRGNVPFKNAEPGIDRSQFFGNFNTSKQSISLNMKSAAAIDIAKQLIRRSDVLIESFAPGAIERMGLGYDEVRKLNPGLIMISTCLMGQTGPAAQLAGYGYHAGAIAGFYEVTGWPDRDPTGPWVAYTDTIAPRFISILLAAALDHRRRTGEGCFMDVAQIETALHFLSPELMDLQINNVAATRNGNRSAYYAPQGCYACAESDQDGTDNWCAIAVDTNDQWHKLCAVIGRADLASDPALSNHAGRIAAHDQIDAAITAWTTNHGTATVMATLQDAGVPAGVVQRSSDLLRDRQYAHRAFYRYLDHPVMGNVPYAGHQYSILGYANAPRAPAPTLGQHSFEILSEFIGLDDESIADAYASGAIS